jgi:hypothetical protein
VQAGAQTLPRPRIADSIEHRTRAQRCAIGDLATTASRRIGRLTGGSSGMVSSNHRRCACQKTDEPSLGS